MNKELENLPRIIRINRLACELTNQELADKAGVSLNVIKKMQSVKEIGSCRIDTLVRVAQALDCDIISLLDYGLYNEYDYVLPKCKKDIEDCKNLQHEMIIKRTYYPPILKTTDISTLMEFLVILPFLSLDTLSDILYRCAGTSINNEQYISNCISSAWNDVPSSNSKIYAEKILEIIRKIRNNNVYGIAEYRDICYCETERQEYWNFIETKSQTYRELSNFFNKNWQI